jgi:hypothetical protein
MWPWPRTKLASIDETNELRLIRQDLHDAMDEVEQTRRQQTRNETSMKPMIATMRQTLVTLKGTPNIMPEQVAAAELQLIETLRFDLGHPLAISTGAAQFGIAFSAPR